MYSAHAKLHLNHLHRVPAFLSPEAELHLRVKIQEQCVRARRRYELTGTPPETAYVYTLMRDGGHFYIGSTFSPRERFSNHRAAKTKTRRVYTHVQEDGGFVGGDRSIRGRSILPCATKYGMLELCEVPVHGTRHHNPDLIALEREFTRALTVKPGIKLLNRNACGLSRFEYEERNRIFARERGRRLGAQKVLCECGRWTTKYSEARHRATALHHRTLAKLQAENNAS
jgi:hypothetical protein